MPPSEVSNETLGRENYRIVYSIEDKGRLVYGVKVGHRKDVYR